MVSDARICHPFRAVVDKKLTQAKAFVALQAADVATHDLCQFKLIALLSTDFCVFILFKWLDRPIGS